MTYDQGTLAVRFPGWEAALVRCQTVAVPRSAIIGAAAGPGWTCEVLGVRFGLVVSGVRKLGTFTHPDGTRRLVSMTRGSTLLRVAVDRAATGFDELLLSTPHASSLAEALRSDLR